MLSWLISDATLLRAVRNILNHLAPQLNLTKLSVQLWDGSLVPLGHEEAGPFRVVLSGPGVISSLLRRPTLNNVVEHYAAGRIDFQGGDLIAFGEAAREKRFGGLFRKVRKWYLFRQLWPFLFRRADRSVVSHAVADTVQPPRKPERNRADFIRFHYDISNEFYRLFLDAEMVYSCAYFTDPEGSLEQAQQDKLEMICRKLRLEPGEKFLDIGCGWGGLLCHAAINHGVRAHGVTLSPEQCDYTRKKVCRLGLQDRVTVELGDYADLEGAYDKIASIGMMEHVGIANYPAYFHKLFSLLRDRGILLNHCIARAAKKTPGEFSKPRAEQRLIQQFIFPGSELDHIGHTLEIMEASRFEVHDVEAWRPHYARTLKLWCRRLSANRDAAIRLVGEEKYRMWVAYLASCSFAFEDGSLRIFQTVATRHKARGLSGMPLTRQHLYAQAESRAHRSPA